MRTVEALVDYSHAIKEETFEGLGFLSTMILLPALPLVIVMIVGIASYVILIPVGYFVALSLVSPKTAEKLSKKAFESYRNADTENIEADEEQLEE